MSDNILPTLQHIKEKRRLRKYGRAYKLTRTYKKFTNVTKRRRVVSRFAYSLAVVVICFELFPGLYTAWILRPANYELDSSAQKILGRSIDVYSEKLHYDGHKQEFLYNTDYKPGSEKTSDGLASGPRFTASFKQGQDKSYTLTDASGVSVTIVPKYDMASPKDNGSRLIYPLRGMDGQKVLSLKASLIKEDIILYKFKKDRLEFKNQLRLPNGTEARLEADGSVGIYGVSSDLLGNVSAATEADAQLLDKARQNGEKTNLLYRIPRPVVVNPDKKLSEATAYYELENDLLTINVTNLRQASYPLSIDPTVYIETAEKLMRGNNETNIDFDVSNELIQKSQTTGARIDAWEGNLDMSEGAWDGGTAAAGGYIYRAGGRTGITKPQIVSQEVTAESTDDTSFLMNMPSERPAGDLYIALMCHDDAADTVTAPGGWTEYADLGEHAAYYKIGTDAGGGNEAASYTWTISSNEAKAGVIVRVTGFNNSDPVGGTPGTDSDGANSIPEFPATTPDNDATLIVRAVGADADPPTDTGWIPTGHTKIASGTSGGGACGFVSGSLDLPPAAGVSSGAVSLADNSINDTWGSSSIAINPAGTTPPPQVADQQTSTQSSNSNSFTMTMPATRPAGDLYVAMMCHDGTGAVSPPSGGGWSEYADIGEHAAYYKIGANVSGGNEAASYTWNMTTGGSTEIWMGVIIRITGFDSSDVESGTPSTNSGGSGTPVFPAVTPDNSNTLVLRSAGIDDDTPSVTGWVPSGHTKIDSGTPNVANDCGYVSAAMDNAPASGVSTGTANFGDSSVNDSWGSSTIAINPSPSGSFTESVLDNVNWAKFNSSNLQIESPNPGEGACSGWCNDPTYDLPSGRRGHSMLAYNGYLYVIGGVDGTGARVSTIYIAKLGANGEPQLWHPTDGDKDNWDYWFTGSGATLNGSTAKSYMGAVAYNNRMYILGGQTNAATTGITTVEKADILPNGILGSWTTTGMQALPGGAGRYMHSVQVYNDTLYTIGGFEGAQSAQANLRNTVYYSKLNSDGTMNAWQQASSFSTARATFGGSFSSIWGAYIYMGGGCTDVNGSGYCTTIASDMQIASINADGSIAPWGLLGGLENTRIGYSLVGWQGGLYRLGGCTSQDPTGGHCASTLADVDYGVVNPAGEVSTVNISTSSGSGSCVTPNYSNCDLPAPGDGADQVGNMLSMTTLINGYLYVIGGCTDYDCSGSTPGATDISGNSAYVSIDSNGNLTAPLSCSGSSYGAWCIESVNQINGATGIAAGGVTTFNGRIYVVGGIDNSGDGSTEIFYNTPDVMTGRPGAWQSTSFGTAGISGELAYTYAYARANPGSAGSNPGNLFTFGGCGDIGTGPGCSGSDYRSHVYKCNIATAGSINGCTTTGQLQIDAELADESDEGLGIHSGTVYANYIYLIGGFSAGVADRDTVFYARFNDSNNVVSVATGAAGGNNDDWILSSSTLSVGRRRGWAFGYNGHIYAVGGYDDSGTGIIPFIEWAKIDVSDGSIDDFVTSSVTINQRWGLSMAVSNSYAYVVGGCNVGASPGSCSSFERVVQTFQLYNNDSGSPVGYGAGANLFSTDRMGASSTVYNGYIYVAGGCTSTTDCTTATNSVQYASLDAYGNVGSWSAGGNLPAARAWGQLEEAGGSLYYIGGQSSTATDERAEVYYTTGISSGNPTWGTASNGLPAERTQHGATVWNNRLYVVGGNNTGATAQTSVYISPDLSSGGDISTGWSTSGNSINVARSGATVIAYANNLYVLGGYTGSVYLSDVQFTQINDDGTIDAWSYTTSLPTAARQAEGFAVNGYMYLVGGRSSDIECSPNTLVAPISANTVIDPDDLDNSNLPTGVGEWYETNQRYTAARYGAAASYSNGKLYLLGGGCEVFPSIAGLTNEIFSATDDTHLVNMPHTINSGDLLLVLFTNDGNATVTDPDGGGAWAEVATQTRGTTMRGSVWAKVASGSEDGTEVDFDTSADEQAAAQVYRIPAGEWSGTLAGVEAASVDPGGTTNAPNPPSLNPGAWGTENTLWFAYAAGSSWTLANSYPTNYSGGTHSISNTGTGGASASSAYFQTSAASQDPGAFGMSTTSDGVAFTVAVRPATGSGLSYTGSNRVAQTAVYSQPQVAMYSRLIDTDSDVFPNSWLMNGLDNSIGARWQVRYRSMNDTDGVAADCGSADMTTWGQETNFGDVDLGIVEPYVPRDGSGNDIECARYFYFFVSIDASRTFGYPEDVNRGPTMTDLSLFFTADPNKRLRHGKTFTGGELQPLDTPCRVSGGGPEHANCPLP